ncbi:tetratricopeptide repeat protein [Chryseobacterium indologenes]|uniref:Uncharacterized protein n=1 Tax=Chryseobacterium indologenes TaxID=253 RepID=A0A0N1KRY3_CHRID|nr:tetratricopeptide repeat protein [Chryseobacterium indologenes]KPE49909.1 hypothetical protein AOB46_17105 [Chryseobacterium indologenes]
MNSNYSPVIKFIALLAIFFILLASCNTSRHDGDNYLYKIHDEVSAAGNKPQKIMKIVNRELEKYKKSGDRLYLISSKYCDLFNYQGDIEIEQVPKAYELLGLNNGKYNFITIACNFSLAYKFVNTSPDQSMQFLDSAIEDDEKTGKMYFLPHMYHLKGKLYYDKKEYNKARLYFNKAMEYYIRRGKESDTLYIASMYSNLGMVYKETNNIDLAIEKLQKGIDILKKKKNPDSEDRYHIQFFSGNLASYLIEKKDYPKAEKLLITELEYCKKNNCYNDAVISSQRLISIYSITGQKDQYDSIINFLISLEPQIKSIDYKIVTNEVFRDYYADNNDLHNLKLISKRLESLQHEYYSISEERLQKSSNSLYKYVLKKTRQEYDDKISDNKNKIGILLILILLTVAFSIWKIIDIRKKNKEEKVLLENQKLELEDNKKLLEQDVQLHKEKNRNLNLNLNLKIETEKAFLENLKKIRRTKNTNIDETLKDLQFKINSLIQIDKKNDNLINESTLENKLFMNKLSNQFPSLTEQELKLCVYFKLNLSSKEVSLLENITSGSVRVYKTKIKSKMGLEKGQDLNSFLNTI